MKNEIGNKYGEILILSQYKGGKVFGKCSCGTEKEFNIRDLRRGATKGCGCQRNTPELRKEASLRVYKLQETGILNVGRTLSTYEQEKRKFLYLLKGVNNKERKPNLDLTWQDIRDIWETQNHRCFYSNIELTLPMHRDHKTMENPWTVASIDRISSEVGYTKSNVQIISRTLNYAKNNMSHEKMLEFLTFIKAN